MSKTSPRRRFGGANIKGTPPMSAAEVRSDLRKLKQHVDILALQEFRHPWYWTVLIALFGHGWRSYPAFKIGQARPTFGAQAILWKTRFVRKGGAYVIPAFNFDEDNAGIMENRWIRAVLTICQFSGLECWYVDTHFVVGGDDVRDGQKRKAFMVENIERLDRVLARCRQAGAPIVLELDANIHEHSQAYAAFIAVIRKHHGIVVGERGVEYLVVFPGLHCKVVIDDAYVLTPKALGLNTDHEVRVLEHHLEDMRSYA